jgi:GntR family transcriptional regulator
MQFLLDPASREPIFQQLVNQVRHQIATRHLRPGDRLPAVRELAMHLVVNPNTVQKAYTELTAAGLLMSRRGQGLFVAEPRPTLAREERRRQAVAAAHRFITDGRLLGFDAAALREIFERQLTNYAEEQPHGR